MFFIDVQGTLISDSDKSPIKGAKELISKLNSLDLPYVIITNNTKEINKDFLEFLRKSGLEIKDNAYLDPMELLGEILPACKVASFGAKEFKNTLQKLGYEEDYENPKAVLIASGTDFTFDEFAKINELVLGGAKFIALHQTSIYKKNGRLYPGVGAICKMIEEGTGIKPLVIGKPSEEFYKIALNLLKKQDKKAEFNKITIISDDAKGDLKGAKILGMKTVLVLSGKVSSPNNSGVDNEKFIDEILPSVEEVLEKL